jgi:hypothetical protein
MPPRICAGGLVYALIPIRLTRCYRSAVPAIPDRCIMITFSAICGSRRRVDRTSRAVIDRPLTRAPVGYVPAADPLAVTTADLCVETRRLFDQQPQDESPVGDLWYGPWAWRRAGRTSRSVPHAVTPPQFPRQLTRMRTNDSWHRASPPAACIGRRSQTSVPLGPTNCVSRE